MTNGQSNPTARLISQYLKRIVLDSAQMKSPMCPENPLLTYTLKMERNSPGADLYEAVARFTVSASHEGAPVYSLNIDYAIMYHVQNSSNEQLTALVDEATPSLLLPFIRRLVGDITLEAGFKPVMPSALDMRMLQQNGTMTNR